MLTDWDWVLEAGDRVLETVFALVFCAFIVLPIAVIACPFWVARKIYRQCTGGKPC